MGNQHSSDDPSLTISPGGTPHILAPRSHPNVLGGTGASSDASINQQIGPVLAAPPLTAHQQRVLAERQLQQEQQTHNNNLSQPPLHNQSNNQSSNQSAYQSNAPESLSDSVRGMLDPSPQVEQPFIPMPQPVNQSKDVFPCAFRWVKGGDDVYVAGSFNNWGGKIAMNRTDDKEWSLVLDVAPGLHQYKYIVDGNWCLDEDAPTAQSPDMIINNVVEVKRPVFEYPNPKDADSDDDDIDEKKQPVDYNQKAPAVNDYFNEPPKLPPQLTQIILGAPSPYSDPHLLPVPDHVTLNHLYLLPVPDSNLICTGITQRFKANSHSRITHKFVTTIYYAPKYGTSSHLSHPHPYASNSPQSGSPNPAHLHSASSSPVHMTNPLSYDQYRQLSQNGALQQQQQDVEMKSSERSPHSYTNSRG